MDSREQRELAKMGHEFSIPFGVSDAGYVSGCGFEIALAFLRE
jgi:hypothetical protein